jgi:hypothetical protein
MGLLLDLEIAKIIHSATQVDVPSILCSTILLSEARSTKGKDRSTH